MTNEYDQDTTYYPRTMLVKSSEWLDMQYKIEHLTAERERYIQDVTDWNRQHDAMEAEIERLRGEVSDRNKKALEGEKTLRAFNELFDETERLRVERGALIAERDEMSAAIRLLQADWRALRDAICRPR